MFRSLLIYKIRFIPPFAPWILWSTNNLMTTLHVPVLEVTNTSCPSIRSYKHIVSQYLFLEILKYFYEIPVMRLWMHNGWAMSGLCLYRTTIFILSIRKSRVNTKFTIIESLDGSCSSVDKQMIYWYGFRKKKKEPFEATQTLETKNSLTWSAKKRWRP
jgi:hypothetical protein